MYFKKHRTYKSNRFRGGSKLVDGGGGLIVVVVVVSRSNMLFYFQTGGGGGTGRHMTLCHSTYRRVNINYVRRLLILWSSLTLVPLQAYIRCPLP